MGEVYRARDTRLSREVAIKVLDANFANEPTRLRRFEKEAQTASALNHPNIVTIHEIGQTDSLLFMAMELVEGKTLRDALFPGPLSISRALQLATQVVDGVARAHEAGIVHRDLKPENIMVTKSGLVKILDFGLAKLIRAESRGGAEESNLPTQTVTGPGMVVGTVGYMSPEQAGAQPIDFRSDQFALGSILYEMCTGKRAFQKKTSVDTLAAILHEEPEPIGTVNPGVPPPLRWLIERCLAKDANDRYTSTTDLAKDVATLRNHLTDSLLSEGQSTGPRPGLRRAIGTVAVALLVALLAGGFIASSLQHISSSSTLRFKRISFGNFTITSARFAPDSQTIVYSTRGESELRTVSTGSPESRSLGIKHAEVGSISVRGDMAVLLDSEVRENNYPTLARAPLGGGTPREILENTLAVCWAPDGDSIAVVHLVDSKYQLEYPMGHILYRTAIPIHDLLLSPDGERVAFREGDSTYFIDRAGNKRTLHRQLIGMQWLRSGRELLVADTRQGETQLRAITPRGRDRLLASLPGIVEVRDIALDGRVLVEEHFDRWRVTGILPTASGEQDLGFLDSTDANDLSTDASALLFTERREGRKGWIYERTTSGSPPILLGEGFGIALSPDRKWALTYPEIPRMKMVLLPIGAGEARPLPNDRELTPTIGDGGAWLPNGKGVVFSAQRRDRPPRIYVQDIIGGMPRPVSSEGAEIFAGKNFVSPDSKSVFGWQERERVWSLYSLEGGPTRTMPLEFGDNPIQWSPEGKSIFVFRRGPSSIHVYLVNLSSGKRREWSELKGCESSGAALQSVLITPDGRSSVVTCHQRLSTLYVVDGLK